MALVGPGARVKLVSFIRWLPRLKHFFQPSNKLFSFYKEYQPLFQEMSERLDIEFIPCLNFEMIKNLKNCL